MSRRPINCNKKAFWNKFHLQIKEKLFDLNFSSPSIGRYKISPRLAYSFSSTSINFSSTSIFSFCGQLQLHIPEFLGRFRDRHFALQSRIYWSLYVNIGICVEVNSFSANYAKCPKTGKIRTNCGINRHWKLVHSTFFEKID